MGTVQIKRLANRHEAIAQWMIANPMASMEECAQEFELTRAWLSTVIHSELFQEYLQGLREDYQCQFIMPLRDKLNGVAHRAVEKLGAAIDNTNDAKFLLEAADKTLHRLGYAPSRGPETAQAASVVQNVVMIDGELLASARQSMLEKVVKPEETQTVELGNDTAERLPSDTGTGEGEPATQQAVLHPKG